MTTPVVFAPAARQDLVDIWEFVAADDIDAADRLFEQIMPACRRIGSVPAIGHRRPDLTSAEVRFWPVRSYLVVYRHREEEVEVVRILSGYRDVAALLDDAE